MGNLRFEGEYLNDLRNGKGKEYSFAGELIFEGIFRKGKIWEGKGKVYNFKGELDFEGKFVNGKRFNECGKK